MMIDLACDTDTQMRTTTTVMIPRDGGPLSRDEEPSSDDLHREIEALIPRLRRYARALTHDFVAADDLVQEALSRALAKIHLWRKGTDLRAWLFTILHNQHVSQIRRAARESGRSQSSENERPPLEPHQGKRLELRDVERAIDKLPEEQRSVILLVGLEEMRYDEVAAILKLPLGTVRSRVARGRETLRIVTGLFPRHHSPRRSRSEHQQMTGHRISSRTRSSSCR